MKKPNNYDKAQEYVPGKKLPAGAYVCKILNVEEQTNDYGKKLILAFDIVEGEFKDFYKENYNNQQSEDKKWKGNYRLSVPDEDAAEDDWSLRLFKTAINRFEESNKGFHWDWDEQKLKGLKIGILIRDKEYDYNGRQGFWSEPFATATVDEVKSGKIKTPETKYLDNSTQNEAVQTEFTDLPDNADGDSIPFNF